MTQGANDLGALQQQLAAVQRERDTATAEVERLQLEIARLRDTVRRLEADVDAQRERIRARDADDDARRFRLQPGPPVTQLNMTHVTR